MFLIYRILFIAVVTLDIPFQILREYIINY